jgi:tRNA uridine 5-carboxymethylaminomethyl modification enzyme
LLAGASAGLAALRRPALTLARDESYIGIMVDDLVSRGCLEPYRMFTSRAEHRLLLRIDNADLRLTPRGRDVGLVGDERWARFESRRARFDRNQSYLRTATTRSPQGDTLPMAQLLRQPAQRLADMVASGVASLDLSPDDALIDLTSVETAVKYEGYLVRQEQAVRRARAAENRRIPDGFRFDAVPGLSRELVDRFSTLRPATLGHAARIPGATPAAVAVVGAYLSRQWPEES